MSTEVRVPTLPESVSDATVLTWHKKPGDEIARDENLVDLETDKVVLEVPSPVAGVVQELKTEEGAVVTADELLAAMDEVLQFDTRTSTATMEVIDARRTRSYRMTTYARGQDDAAVLYLEPAREKGTKMLRKDDNLWLYMPRAERVQKISGHMLRQGMMGSDMSYEDMREAAAGERSSPVAGSSVCCPSDRLRR